MPKKNFRLATSNYKRGNYEEAIKSFATLSETNPTEPLYRVWQAKAESRNSQKQESLRSLQNATRLGWNLHTELAADEAFANNDLAKNFLRSQESVYNCQRPIVQERCELESSGYPRPDGQGQRYFLSTVLGALEFREMTFRRSLKG